MSVFSHLSVEESIERRENLGWGVAVAMNLGTIMRNYLSPCLIVQTNVDDFMSVNKSRHQNLHVQKVLCLFLVHSCTLSHWLFLDLKQERKDVIVLYIVCNG